LLTIARDHREAEAPPDPRVGEAARTALARSLQLLEARERNIVERHFGLGARGKGQSLDEIGRELGLSKERVRILELRALAKLREDLGDGVAELLAG
jgi:RNA polymerase sigma factor (sigma-70 family)